MVSGKFIAHNKFTTLMKRNQGKNITFSINELIFFSISLSLKEQKRSRTITQYQPSPSSLWKSWPDCNRRLGNISLQLNNNNVFLIRLQVSVIDWWLYTLFLEPCNWNHHFVDQGKIGQWASLWSMFQCKNVTLKIPRDHTHAHEHVRWWLKTFFKS